MRINYDCIRSLLLTLEDILIFDDNLEMPIISLDSVCNCELMKSYQKKDIYYSSIMLDEAGYIECNFENFDDEGRVLFSRLTLDGHQYLDTIRSNKVWSTIKDKIFKHSLSFSFEIIKECAIKFITSSF